MSPASRGGVVQSAARPGAWLTLGLGVIGLGLSLVLAWLSVAAQAAARLPGCGEGSSCTELLSGPWSDMLGLPVALLAVGTYTVLVWALLFVKFGSRHQRFYHAIAIGLAGAIAAAAVWFVFLQGMVIESFCVWCTATHAVGLVLAATVVVTSRCHVGRWIYFVVCGVLGVAAMAAVQWQWPTAPVEPMPIVFTPASQPASLAADEPEYPSVHLEVFYDYACPKCVVLHRKIDQAVASNREPWDSVLIHWRPIAAGRGCGSPLNLDMARFSASCVRAELAERLRSINPRMFEAFDHRLLQAESMPDALTAERWSREIAGDRLDDPASIEAGRTQLQRNHQELKAILQAQHRRVIPVVLVQQGNVTQAAITTDLNVVERLMEASMP